MNYDRINHISQQYTFEEVLAALALKGLQMSKDMHTDFIQDPDYVKSEGLPTKDVMLAVAQDHVAVIMPEMMLESVEEVFENVNGVMVPPKNKEEESNIACAIRVLTDWLVRVRPDLIKLEYTPK